MSKEYPTWEEIEKAMGRFEESGCVSCGFESGYQLAPFRGRVQGEDPIIAVCLGCHFRAVKNSMNIPLIESKEMQDALLVVEKGMAKHKEAFDKLNAAINEERLKEK